MRRREPPAPEREGVGSGGKGEQERGPEEGGGKRWRAGKAEKGGEGDRAEEKFGGWECPRHGPFPVVGLASSSAARGQGSPTRTPTHPVRRSPQGWLPDQGHVEVRASPEACLAW